MKTIHFTLLLLIFSKTISFSQTNSDSNIERSLNNLNIVWHGRVSIFSINYEHLYLLNPHFFIAGEVGIGEAHEIRFMGNSSAPSHIAITQKISGNYGGRKNFFEFGFIANEITNYQFQNFVVCPLIGYRLHPMKSGKINFKVTASYPVFGFNQSSFDKGEELLWFSPIGVSVGVNF